MSKQYKITGKPFTARSQNKQKKAERVYSADCKQDIWNHPEDFGFSKIFKVEELKSNERKKDYW